MGKLSFNLNELTDYSQENKGDETYLPMPPMLTTKKLRIQNPKGYLYVRQYNKVQSCTLLYCLTYKYTFTANLV